MITKLRLYANVFIWVVWMVVCAQLCVIVQNTFLTCKLLKSNIETQFLTRVLNKIYTLLFFVTSDQG